MPDGSTGRQYNVQMASNNTQVNALTASYTVYVDNGDGSFLPANETSVANLTGISLYSGNAYNSGRQSYTPYSKTPPSANHDLWVLASVTSNTGQFSQLLRLTNGCAVLPVSLKNFTASRSGNAVKLTWVTSLEVINKGFEIQRQQGQGSWEKIGFMESRATGGNSNSDLSYQFTDANSSSGPTNYRLLQVDLDGQYAYSPVRVVPGVGQAGRTVIYPNPSPDGQVNVVFKEATGTRDVLLLDMTGRQLHQWSGVTGNSLQISSLTPGIYSLRVLVRETGEADVQKIIITTR